MFFKAVVPRQFPSEELFEAMSTAGDAVSLSASSAMGSNMLVTLLFSVSLKALWNLTHVLQIMYFLPELVEWPPHAQLIIESL